MTDVTLSNMQATKSSKGNTIEAMFKLQNTTCSTTEIDALNLWMSNILHSKTVLKLNNCSS